MKKFVSVAAFLTSLLLVFSCGQRLPKTADLLITGGTVYDGSEKGPVKADIAVVGNKIVYVAPAKADIVNRCAAKRTINAEGYVVCPGFIDPHDHLEPTLLKDRANESYLRMGVTTVIPGMCGGSRYPIGDFFAKLEEQGIGTNVASFTGHNTIREQVMGDEARYATPEEVEKMKELVRQEMRDGSLGLSTGLFYVPGCFSETSEVVELMKEMGKMGGMYTTHVRNENKFNIGLVNSIREALEIGKAAGVPVNISHIKCLGRSEWYKADSVINLIESYQQQGMKVTADQYPYLASGIGMASALTPAWCRDGGTKAMRERFKDPELLARIKAEIPDILYERGGAETIYISKNAGEYSQMTLAEAAAKMKKSPVDAIIELLSDKTKSPYLNTFIANEEDLTKYMKQPWVMSCTDGSFGSHPRAAGTYAELIKQFVVEKRVLTLDRFIRRSTGQVAETYGLKNRGFLRKGCFADITIFKPEEVVPHATYADPTLFATGFKNVIVNGEIAVENDVYTGTLSGMVLRHEVKK